MGNLICCYGKEDRNRGGKNVKAILRKTEKPGKRRKRIDDLVLDALKREQRGERLRKTREKKGTLYKDNQNELDSTPLSKKTERQTLYDEETNKVINNVEEDVIASDHSVKNQTASKEDGSVATNERENDTIETSLIETQTTTINKCGTNTDFDHDFARMTTNLSEEEETIEMKENNAICTEVNENRQVDKLTKSLEIDEVLEIDTDNEIMSDDGELTNRIENSFEKIVKEMTDEKEKQGVDSTGEFIHIVTSSEKCMVTDEDTCDKEEGEVKGVTEVTGDDESQRENCDSDEDDTLQGDISRSCKAAKEDNVRDDTIAESMNEYEDDKPGCDLKDISDDDNQIEDTLNEPEDTDGASRYEENTQKVNENKTVNILTVHDTDNFTGYDDTHLTYYNDDDEMIGNDSTLKPIPRSRSMPLKRWGSSNDLGTGHRTHADTRRDINSFRKHLTKLKQIYAFSNTRGISLKSHLHRQSTKRSTLKKVVMNLALHGEQKPQIKEILRLKKDPFNFPPKLRQFTERDRHGSIADLRWSRHMRAEVRRHITMELDEFEEVDESEFDVCDEPRASTPIHDYVELRAPTPVPGFDNPEYDSLRSPSPLPDQDFPRAPSPDFRCAQRKTKATKIRETMKNLRERYGTDRARYTKPNTPNRLTPCSRHSRLNTVNHRLDTPTGERKKAAFQTIVRQFEKSFKDAEARRSRETRGQTRNNTSYVGIGR